MSENWREERDRLIELLRSISDGTTTHFDHPGRRELLANSAENVAMLEERLAILNVRLGDRTD